MNDGHHKNSGGGGGSSGSKPTDLSKIESICDVQWNKSRPILAYAADTYLLIVDA